MPGLADSWEVSPDARQYTFKLKLAVKAGQSHHQPDYERITRGTVLSLKQREFVLAARVIGYLLGDGLRDALDPRLRV